ncbi:hypothetical protein MLD38_000813 [Melastoma candidum]|uniref:Uncharacterized protein n=1 Tax=Melastoma candidum TaxID=119954 RepID=A0ACB9SEL5_9MYRT|nr:hypothetical protein MLD38_000813 [Melastoma candidum]
MIISGGCKKNVIAKYSDAESIVTFLITALQSCRSILSCEAIHGRVIKSVSYRHGFIGDQFVSKYVELGQPGDAEKLFDEISHKDAPSWNSLISSFSDRRCFRRCWEAFSRMKSEADVRPNDVTLLSVSSSCAYVGALDEGKLVHGMAEKIGAFGEVKVSNSLINMYRKSGDYDSACRLFIETVEKSLVTWNLMIAIYAEQGLAAEGMLMFDRMRTDCFRPDDGTMMAVLRACEESSAVSLVDATLALVLKSGFYEQMSISTAILDLFAKAGRLDDAKTVFGQMINPDRVAWTAMLSAYASQGRGSDAIELFNIMVSKGIEPDHVTFTHLLNACSHSGFLEQGKLYFNSMIDSYGIAPRVDHYSCMVDLLGRCGLVQEAYELIKGNSLEPNSAIWGALLGACKIHKDVVVGKEAAERLISMDPTDPRNYIMISSMYSEAGMCEEATRVRMMMKANCPVRLPGLSSVQ